MIVVGSCYFLLTLLIPYDPNIDFVFPLNYLSRSYISNDVLKAAHNAHYLCLICITLYISTINTFQKISYRQ